MAIGRKVGEEGMVIEYRGAVGENKIKNYTNIGVSPSSISAKPLAPKPLGQSGEINGGVRLNEEGNSLPNPVSAGKSVQRGPIRMRTWCEEVGNMLSTGPG